MLVRKAEFFKSIDWWTIVLYVIMVVAGWLTIHAASYDYDDSSMFTFQQFAGKQFMWMLMAFALAIVIMSVDTKIYMTYPPVIYVLMMILLLVTIFIAPGTKGSHSWLPIGSVKIQPAEFAKTATVLMLAWLFNGYNYKFTKPWNFLKACLIVLLPVGLIIAQKETGSALVYFSLILLFYRRGMSGIVLFSGFTAIMIFVLGLKYSVDLETGEPLVLGQNIVLTIIPFLISGMCLFYAKKPQAFWITFGVASVASLCAYILENFVPLPFEWKYRWVTWAVCLFDVLYCFCLWLFYKYQRYLTIGLFSLAFIGFLFSVEIAFNKLDDHQRRRIEVLLGMREDLKGAGYNVNQAKIAIGSGGLTGKGYLEGTQTKLSYVPEQHTDFIFCTIGEEEGFAGSLTVLVLFGILILRLIYLAERQRTIFAQVYGYGVVSIFAIHVFINIGMVIGLCPVIGIPLPFFSYGGSGLWSFTILLFIFLKLDAARTENY